MPGDDNRGANLNDVLQAHGGANGSFRGKIDGQKIEWIYLNGQRSDSEIYTDPLSEMRYFFAVLPIEGLYHDIKINPRAIGSNVRGLVEEFFKKLPQLHVALGWLNSSELPTMKVHIFDGQHKAAAQILLGSKKIPVRIFIDPDFSRLLTANTNAGTKLKQVAFDKSVQRRLGSTQLIERLNKYRNDRGLPEDDESFSEQALVDYYKGDQKTVAKFILDSVRDAITFHQDNGLREFVEYAGKGNEKPFSYSTIEKTFYSQLIGTSMLSTSWNHKSEVGENPRSLEIAQICKLMSILSDCVYVGKYQSELGTSQIENKVQNNKGIPEEHLRAYRMAKEEILYAWLRFVPKIIENYFVNNGSSVDTTRLFQIVIPDQLWANIRNFIVNLADMPFWVNLEASSTVFGGKQNSAFWQKIFETGESTSGHKVMPKGLNWVEMIKPR